MMSRPADGVHAVVNPMQPAVGEPALDRVPVDSGVGELPPCDTPVLLRRKGRDRGEVAAHAEA